MAHTSNDLVLKLNLSGELGLEAEVMKRIHDSPTSDDAWEYQVPLNYLEWIRSYGQDKRKFTVYKWMETILYDEDTGCHVMWFQTSFYLLREHVQYKHNALWEQ